MLLVIICKSIFVVRFKVGNFYFKMDNSSMKPRILLEYERQQKEAATSEERYNLEQRFREQEKMKTLKKSTDVEETYFNKIHDPRAYCCQNKAPVFSPDPLKYMHPLPWVSGSYGGHIPLKSQIDIGKSGVQAAHQSIWFAKGTGRIPLNFMLKDPSTPEQPTLIDEPGDVKDILLKRANMGKSLFNFSKKHGYSGCYPGRLANIEIYDKCKQAATAKFFEDVEKRKVANRSLESEIMRNSLRRSDPAEMMSTPLESPDLPLKIREYAKPMSLLDTGVVPGSARKSIIPSPLNVRNCNEHDIAFVESYTGHIPDEWQQYGCTKSDQYRAALHGHHKRQVLCKNDKAAGYYMYRTDMEVQLLKAGKLHQLSNMPSSHNNEEPFKRTPGYYPPDKRSRVVGLSDTEVHLRTKRVKNEGELELLKDPSKKEKSDKLMQNIVEKYQSECKPKYELKQPKLVIDKEAAIKKFQGDHGFVEHVENMTNPITAVNRILPGNTLMTCKPESRKRDYKQQHFLRGYSKPMDKYVTKYFYSYTPTEYKIKEPHRKPNIETTFDNHPYPYVDNEVYNKIAPSPYNENNYFFMDRTSKDIPRTYDTTPQILPKHYAANRRMHFEKEPWVPQRHFKIDKDWHIGWSNDKGHPWDKEKSEQRKLQPNEEKEYDPPTND